VSPLADEQSCHEAAAGATALAKLALAVRPRARPRRHTCRRNIPRTPSSFVEVAPTHPELLQGGLTTPLSTTLAGATSPCRSVVNEQCQAAARQKALAEDKRRQEESAAIRRIRVKCALLAAPLNAILAKIERDNIAHEANEQQRAAAQDKALADEANELRQVAAAREKALADEADELRQAAAWEKALADEANKRRRADTLEKALADEADERRWAATRKKALANEVNKRHCRPSTTVDGQPQTACCRSRPRLRVGFRHGPRAPNPQERLLRGQRHRPRAPNQSTVNGWA
jgi:hypothetical protein